MGIRELIMLQRVFMPGLFVALLFNAPAFAITAQEKMKTCNDKAKDMKGDDRKAFMKTCLSAKPEKPKSKMAMCNEKTKGMSKPDADKARSECLKG